MKKYKIISKIDQNIKILILCFCILIVLLTSVNIYLTNQIKKDLEYLYSDLYHLTEVIKNNKNTIYDKIHFTQEYLENNCVNQKSNTEDLLQRIRLQRSLQKSESSK